ncbi:hypothetical protein MF271_20970 (plasmid) [Deinococcus sp. KNUC1210]|uniref:hypothetical protein n=1 Tax=Deinococcus sp. KNUC1210 TaxID=2917691 RepID=UPI001EF0ABB3|nr:hypothetical protein [Deinococcus sp. KNUC1210]ULH17527.1 hypothetical protein MF271_20970 [Deinococcus sp. KNUC1210]
MNAFSQHVTSLAFGDWHFSWELSERPEKNQENLIPHRLFYAFFYDDSGFQTACESDKKHLILKSIRTTHGIQQWLDMKTTQASPC